MISAASSISSDNQTPVQAPELEESERVNENDLPPQRDDDLLPVVGLGGSAGSIRALREFFEHIPPDLGIAYVVVIHLSPDYESLLPQILQARTAMEVVGVAGSVTLKANCIYVIPPSYHLIMRDGQIMLSEPQQATGTRVAVDLLFRTLAATHRSKAVAVVLSGADGDGSIGVKRIKEHGGVTIAQDPDEAEYNEMPRSAINTGMVDWILPVAQIAAKLTEWIKNERQLHLPTPEQTESPSAEEADVLALRETLAFLQTRTGHDFSHYKRATVLRRIGRRLQVNSLESLPQYANFLRTHPGEAGALLQDLLISVTNFFRDPESFAALEAHVGQLFRGKRDGDAVRVWVPACATGEEAYSMAMLLLEYADTLEHPPEIQIFATDLDQEALQTARDGVYPQTIVADVSPERLRRFFVSDQGGFRLKKEVRERILFAPHNVLKDAPFSRLDLISCRNLLIYFNREAQNKVLELFNFALRANGMLFLGGSESAEGNPLFVMRDRKHAIYEKQIVAQPLALPVISPNSSRMREVTRLRHTSILPPDWFGHARQENVSLSAAELHQHLLAQTAAPSILVNSDYEMLHLSGNAGRYVQYLEGEVSHNLLSSVHPSLRIELRTALFSALQTGIDVDVAPMAVEVQGEVRQLKVRVRPQPVTSGVPSPFAIVLFEEAPLGSDMGETVLISPANSDETVRRLEEELLQLRSYLRAAAEEHEVTSEELKAYNEELQAINEEQRSSAEELETSREEIQAANEELTTVNAELKVKVDEVSRANADLQNLIASTDIAIIFLNRDGRIKRYTPRALELFRFIPSDIGRPLADLKHHFQNESFIDDAREVTRMLAPTEREIETLDGRWFLSRVSPYRTLEDYIDGVVISFVDITKRKHDEQTLRESEAQQAFLVRLGDALRPLSEANEILITASCVLGEYVGANRVGYAEAQPDGETIVVTCNYTNAVPGIEGRYHYIDYGTALLDELRTGRTIVRSNIAADPLLSEAEKEAHKVLQLGATLNKPLRKVGELIAVMFVHYREAHEWSPTEIVLLNETAERTWEAVERARAEAAVRKSREHLQLALTAANMGTFVWHPLEDRGEPDERMLALFGVPTDGTLTLVDAVSRMIHPNDGARYAQAVSRALDPNEAGWLQEDIRVIHPDGSLHWLAVTARTEFEEGPPRRAIRMPGMAMDITERKRAEEALRQSEERLRMVIEATAMYWWVVDLTTGQITYSDNVLHVIREESIVSTLEEERRLSPERNGLIAPIVEQVMRGQDNFTSEHRHINARGEEIWLETQSIIIRDAEGQPTQITGISRDITERKHAEEALRASEAHLGAIFTQVTVGLSEISLEGRFLRVNDEMCRINNRTPEEMLQLGVADITHPDDLAGTLEIVGRLMETGVPDSLDKRYVRPDGSWVWANSNIGLLRDSEGNALHLLAVTVDLTERYHAEEAVRESEARLRLVVESVTEYAIITTNPNGIITGWNAGAQKAFGWNAKEVLGQPVAMLFTPEDRERGVPEAEMRQARDEGRAGDERWHLRRDGRRFFVSGVLSPLGEGAQNGYVKIARDLTLRRESQAALRESEERFRIAVDAGELGTWDWDVVRDEVIWNERHFLLFAKLPRPGIVKAADFAVHIHPEDRDYVMERLMTAVERAGFFEAEFRVIREDGVMRWMNGYGRTVEAHDGHATRMCGVMLDSTERREAQEVLRRSHEELEKLVEERTRELAQALELVSAEMVQRVQAEADRALLMKRIVNTQEEERGRISRELHDNLGQHLTAVMLGLQALESQIYAITGEQKPEDIPQLAKLRRQVDELMRVAHSQARELRPAELDAMGLDAALGQYIKDWSGQIGIPCDFQSVGWEDKRPSSEIETTLYRVVQEALTNVARHANASQVSVVLELGERNVSAIIEDNGRGFDPENVAGRLGILGMKERLALAGGTLDIESAPGQGTTIYARMPLSPS